MIMDSMLKMFNAGLLCETTKTIAHNHKFNNSKIISVCLVASL